MGVIIIDNNAPFFNLNKRNNIMATVKKQSINENVLSFNTGTRVENRLTFKPRSEDGFICKGSLISVSVEMNEVPKIKENGQENTSEYAGYTVPNLVMEFQQVGTTADPKPRFYKHRWNMTATRSKDGAPMDKKDVISIVSNNIKQVIHILQAYEGVPGYDLSDLNVDINPFAPIEDRIATYTKFFEFAKETLVGSDPTAPIHKSVAIWIKLVAEYTRGTHLTLPNFIGQGFIERIQNGVKTSLSFAPKETYELRKTSDKKTAGSNPMESSASVNEDVAKIMEQYQ